MQTLTADAKKRVRLPDAKPRQVFAYTNNGDGSFTLTVVKAERKPAFPHGSLLKCFAPKRNKQELARAAACSLENGIRAVGLPDILGGG